MAHSKSQVTLKRQTPILAGALVLGYTSSSVEETITQVQQKLNNVKVRFRQNRQDCQSLDD